MKPLCSQDFAKLLSGIFTQDPFIHFIKKGITSKSVVSAFAFKLLSAIQAFEADSDSCFRAIWAHDCFESVRDAQKRCEMFCRAILHFFCHQVPEGCLETADTDVRYFTEYSGEDPSDKDSGNWVLISYDFICIQCSASMLQLKLTLTILIFEVQLQISPESYCEYETLISDLTI